MATGELVPHTVLGLPTHALIVHATVVLLPLTTLLLLLCAFSGRVRARAGLLLPLAGIVSVVLVPLTTSSGEQLRDQLPTSPLIEKHAAAADDLLPWAIALAVMTVVLFAADRYAARSTAGVGRAGVGRTGPGRPRPLGAAVLPRAAERVPRAPWTPGPVARGHLDPRSALSVAVAVLATVAAVGTGVQVAHVGHLGAEAAWSYAKDLPVQPGH